MLVNKLCAVLSLTPTPKIDDLQRILETLLSCTRQRAPSCSPRPGERERIARVRGGRCHDDLRARRAERRGHVMLEYIVQRLRLWLVRDIRVHAFTANDDRVRLVADDPDRR